LTAKSQTTTTGFVLLCKKGIEKQKADTDIISYSYFNGSLLFLYVLIVSLYESLAKKTMSTQFVSLCYRKPSNNYTMCLQNVQKLFLNNI